MSAFPRRRGTQRGAALILMMTIIVMGIAWYTVGALGRVARSTADREIATGQALQKAKRAMLDYIAATAADPKEKYPGRLPCPEHEWYVGNASKEGIAGPAVGVSDPGWGSANCASIGRLPWRTLGLDQIRDSDGELLWYAVTAGSWSLLTSSTTLTINPGKPGPLSVNGQANAAVAVIIAPGAALNTMSEAGSPVSPCAKVNELAATRYTAPLSAANFLECGNTVSLYSTIATSPWSNDRVITITAAEVMDAIAGPVGDRLQRQVAALIGNWHQVEFDATGRSWGNTYGLSYLPFASDWNNPSSGNFCANVGQGEGLAPVDTTCTAYDNKWSANAGAFGGMDTVGACTDQGTYLRCRFRRTSNATPLTATIIATTTNVGHAFRSTIAPSDLTIGGGGSATISMSLPNATSDATATINVSWPLTLPNGTTIDVQIPHLQNAAFLSDTRYTWFWNNNWHQYTYYAIAPAAEPPGNTACTPGTNCITVTGLPASTGASNDKRLVMVLSGRALATQTQPSNSRSNYFELENATTGDREYQVSTIGTTFNDRVAVCPFQYPKQSGTLTICN